MMNEKVYVYFVSFWVKSRNPVGRFNRNRCRGGFKEGCSNMSVSHHKDLTTLADAKELERLLMKSYPNVSEVKIINWRLLQVKENKFVV